MAIYWQHIPPRFNFDIKSADLMTALKSHETANTWNKSCEIGANRNIESIDLSGRLWMFLFLIKLRTIKHVDSEGLLRVPT